MQEVRIVAPKTSQESPPPPPGVLVEARGERWRVVESVTHEGCVACRLTGAEPSNAGVSRTLLLPFDRATPLKVRERWRRVGRRRWVLALRALLASDVMAGGLRGAAGAQLDLLEYQLEPAIAAAGGAMRLLLADEVGLGKTVQAGFILADLAARSDAARALVLCPAGLCGQWQQELERRFALHPVVVDLATLRRLSHDAGVEEGPWHRLPLSIASVDFVKRPEVLQGMAGTRWDALVVDEAHLSALAPERAAAVNWIARRSRRVVLVTATPHPGEPEAFDALCRIGRLAGEGPLVMFRRTRADLGVPVNRRTRVVLVTPSRVERRLHAALHRYCSRVWSARAAPDGVCADARLAMLVLTKRSASGTAPLLRSLERRFDLLARAGEAGATQLFLPLGEPDHEAADEEPATVLAAPGLESRETELCVLARLIDLARSAGPSDAKLRALARLLRRARQPAIVFTEYRDALTAVARQLPPALPVACVHGGMDRRERDEAIRAFTHGGARVLLATDAAAHGLNLQARCRLVINLDLPWNPVRLEQRIGRVDRIGQTRAVHAVHLVARGTSERRVLERLTTRSALARVALGGGANPAGIDPEAMVAARVFGRTSGPWCKSRRSTEGGDAPGRQGATTENIGQYSTEEQRRRAGCSVGRMPARPAPRAATGGGPRNDCRIAAIPMAPADWQAGPGGASPPFRRIDLAAAARQELARLGRLRLLRARGSRTLHDVAARLDAASPWWTTLRLPGRGCSRVVGLYLAEIVDGRGALHERLLIPVEGGVCLPVRPPLLSWEACAGAALQAARARIEAACNAIRPRLQAEQARERGLGDLVESVPVLSVQAGLFDRRADRQLSAGRGEVERLREETRNRVAALDRTADLQLVSPPRLVLVALVRGG